jgi:hypothetical protein
MTTLSKEEMKELVDALYDRTVGGRLEWKKAFEDRTFETRVAVYIVQVARAFDAEVDEEYTEIILQNAVGDELARIYPSMLAGLPLPPKFNLYHKLFDALYGLASRQGLGVDKAVRDILGELKKP